MAESNPVSLRRPTDEDSQRLYGWRNSPEVSRWMYTDHQITLAEHEQWFAKAMVDPSRSYWIIEAGGAPVGMVNLYDIDRGAGRCVWAYYLAEPSVRGRGVGAVVEFMILEEVLIYQGMNKLWCEVLADNKAVLRLHQRFGFTKEAVFRQHIQKSGAFVDVVGLGMLRREWLGLRETSAEMLHKLGHPVELKVLEGLPLGSPP